MRPSHLRITHYALAAAALLAAYAPLAQAAGGPLLLVTAAGRFSCLGLADATAVYDESSALEAKLKAAGQDVQTLDVCYGSGEQSLRLRQGGAAAFVATDLVETDVLAKVAAQARAIPGTRVAIVGYSYGGWLALRLADTLPEDVEIVTLATIDPISTVTCSTWAYARGASGLGAIDPGCTQTPPDLAPQFKRVAARVKDWRHFYEPDSPYLHATPVTEATKNYEQRFSPPAWKTFQAHLDIAVAGATWNAIGEGLGLAP